MAIQDAGASRTRSVHCRRRCRLLPTSARRLSLPCRRCESRAASLISAWPAAAHFRAGRLGSRWGDPSVPTPLDTHARRSEQLAATNGQDGALPIATVRSGAEARFDEPPTGTRPLTPRAHKFTRSTHHECTCPTSPSQVPARWLHGPAATTRDRHYLGRSSASSWPRDVTCNAIEPRTAVGVAKARKVAVAPEDSGRPSVTHLELLRSFQQSAAKPRQCLLFCRLALPATAVSSVVRHKQRTYTMA